MSLGGGKEYPGVLELLSCRTSWLSYFVLGDLFLRQKNNGRGRALSKISGSECPYRTRADGLH